MKKTKIYQIASRMGDPKKKLTVKNKNNKRYRYPVKNTV